jgi:hypothetical protein
MTRKACGVVSQGMRCFLMAAVMTVFTIGALAVPPAPTNISLNPVLSYLPSANGYFVANNDIVIQIEFDRDIAFSNQGNTSAKPYLALTLYPENAVANRAVYHSVSGKNLRLKYRTTPGAYAWPLTSNRGDFYLDGAAIYSLGGDPTNDVWDPSSDIGLLPDPAGPAGLAAANIRVRTVTINPQTSTVLAGDKASLTVRRGGNWADEMIIALSPSGSSVATVPPSVTILANRSEISFDVTGASTGVINITAHPVDYPDGEGIVTNIFTVVPNPNQYLVLEPIEGQARPPYPEGPGSYLWRVRRVGSTAGALSVSLVSSVSSAVKVPLAPLIIRAGTNTTVSFPLDALDGNFASVLTATDPSGNFTAASEVIDVRNIDPSITGGMVTPGTVTIRQTVTAFYMATDVAADLSKLTGTWNWGDGTAPATGFAPGASASHAYAAPGDYTVSLTVSDTEGGTTPPATYPVKVTPGKTLTVSIRAPGEEGLMNVGSGIVQFTPSAPVTNFVDGSSISVQYPDTQASVSLMAMPNQPDADGFSNYVFQIVGDGLSEAAQIQRGGTTNSVTVMVTLDGDSTAEVLFSREWRKGDGRGDIDGDGLTDAWELQWELDPLRGSGSSGSGGAPSGDRMPNADNMVLDPLMTGPDGEPYGGPFAYPIVWLPGWTGYAPTGPLFNNMLQFRGQSIPITDADYPGTDPTVSDTSGDGLTDGWLYYFLANAVNDPDFTGRVYDPASMTNSLVLSNADIRYYFNPRFNRGLAGKDLDGDGLLTSEEYTLGTNPIDWDTDGDGLPDGWEVYYETDPLDPLDALLNPDNDYMAAVVGPEPLYPDLLIHRDVYDDQAFDPRTGWSPNILLPTLVWEGESPNTREYRTIDEFLSMRWRQIKAAEAAEPEVLLFGPLDWPFGSTDPLNADTDGDGCADGWELYVGMNPTDTIGGRLDGSQDSDGDGLPNMGEFSCQGATVLYAGVGLFPMQDPGWLNKFWPTDPNDEDTDLDQAADGDEAGSSRYTGQGGAGALAGSCYPGGGLNPCSADTDGDFLPDAWESLYTGGFGPDGNRLGMDGTFGDAYDDYDNDGLFNYQEYLTGVVYHFQYDKWLSVGGAGLGYGTYDPNLFFTPVEDGGYGRSAKHWDPADTGDGYFFILAEPRPEDLAFANTSPLLWDSDEDAMDDYYEMYHGLNPLWSLTVDIVNMGAHPFIGLMRTDVRAYPWATGDQFADPDQDGIPNFEEMLMPNRPAPQNHHTDPTPLWITDMSYPDSMVNLYYTPGFLMPPYWWVGVPKKYSPPSYMFSFECNEGYDTDNDNRSDKDELLGTDGTGSTDPLNFLSPASRKALYFDGDAAARTRRGFAHSTEDLRSWTVELWIRPAQTATGERQILIERPLQYFPGSPLPLPPDGVVRNFRLGFEPDGRLFTECDNFGVTNLLTAQARASADFVKNGEWCHVAGVMDGTAKTLSLYVNGQLRQRTPTAGIPATGIFEGQPAYIVASAPIVLGAADANPNGYVSGAPPLFNFMERDTEPQPSLHSYYRGHIDEVRIWNGARTGSEITATMMKAFTKADVESVAVTSPNGLVQTNGMPSAGAVLFYHYNFNSLPDPDHEPIVPTDFADLNGRPDSASGYPGVQYTGIPWWEQAVDRSTVYTDYNFVHWMENTVAHLPLDFAFDSKYWSLNTTGGVMTTNLDGTVLQNVYPNSMNPYGYGYTHDLNNDLEVNPDLGGPYHSFGFDPGLFRMYNDLLPLRNVEADLDVELWDGRGAGTVIDVLDSNGDGIPDWWYLKYGFDPFGPSVAHEDPDGDGLSNHTEYLIGSDPNNMYSMDPAGLLIDYDWRATPGSLTYGELYTAGDGIPVLWKLQYSMDAPTTGNPGLRLDRYDADLDPDEDGWSNLAEYLGSYGSDSNLVRSPSPLDATRYPMPEIKVRLRYSGELGSSIANVIGAARPVRVSFHRTPERDGHPVGLLTMETGTVTTRALSSGHLIEGGNYLFAYLDANNNGVWDTDWTNNYSEAAGIAVLDAGWGDGMEVDVELTHEAKGYWRFAWAPVPGALGYKVELRVAGTTVYTRQISGNDRTFFHEGDFQVGGLLGLQPATYSALIYSIQDFYGVEPAMYRAVTFRKNTNTVSTTVQPVIMTPQGIVMTEARGSVEWLMDPYATRYEIQIANANAGGVVGSTLLTTTRMRPNHDVNGNYRDSMPFYAGDTGNVGQVWTNGVYWMRLRGLSDNGNTPYSEWRSFTVNVKTPETGGKSAIEGDLFYFGRVQRGSTNTVRYLAGETKLSIIVQAFRNAGFAGEPTAQVQVNASRTNVRVGAAYELNGLVAGTYYVRAFIDLNGNRKLDLFEPRDMRRNGYEPQSVDATASTGIRVRGQRIVLRDHDMDDDNMADGWEYSWLQTLDYGPDNAPAGDGVTLLATYLASGILPGLSPLSAYSYGPDVSDRDLIRLASKTPYQDRDGDGMSDLQEIIYAKTSPDDGNDVLKLLTQESVMPMSGGTSGNGYARIVWQGKSGVQYVVLSSPDLVHWTVRQEYLGTGTHSFEETDSARTRQFYRVDIR